MHDTSAQIKTLEYRFEQAKKELKQDYRAKLDQFLIEHDAALEKLENDYCMTRRALVRLQSARSVSP